MGTPEPLDAGAIRHEIDRRTPGVPEDMSRSDIVAWLMVNYLAGVRDALAGRMVELPWELLTDPEVRAQLASAYSGRMREIVQISGVPDPTGGDLWRPGGVA